MDGLSSDLDKTTLGERPLDCEFGHQGQIIEFWQNCDNFVSNGQIWFILGQMNMYKKYIIFFQVWLWRLYDLHCQGHFDEFN